MDFAKAAEQAPVERLGERLAAARQRRFVGRAGEISLFRSLLLAGTESPGVLWIHGLGGVGKSTLLAEYARIARESGASVAVVDARDADGFAHANPESVRDRFPAPPTLDAVDNHRPGVLIIDAFEKLHGVADWLFADYLPALPGTHRIVVAGREPAPLRWRTDPGWGSLVRHLHLDNFDRAEAETFLVASGIPPEHHESILTYTRGHPLALSLAADCQRALPATTPFDLADHPDVVAAILERLVQQIDDEARRDALIVLALARSVNEALLAAVIGPDAAPQVFSWLRSLSFVASDRNGLFAHDLARDVLETDAAWRDPGRRERVSRAVVLALEQRLVGAGLQVATHVWLDLIYACRGNRDFASVFDYSTMGDVRIAPASGDQIPQFVEAIRRFRGPESAAQAEWWCQRQPAALLAYIDDDDRPIGFMMHLRLTRQDLDGADQDPVIRHIAELVDQDHSPLPHGSIWISRFLVDLERYQAPSRSLNLTAVACSIQWTTDPEVAWNFICVDDPEQFAPHFRTIHMMRFPDGDVAPDSRPIALFGHDWRAETVAEWLDNKSRIVSNTQSAARQEARRPAALGAGLTREAFDLAVRQALRDLHDTAALGRNPLAASVLATPGTSGASRAVALRQRLADAIREAGTVPRSRMHLTAVDVTYLRPAGSQELAAEALSVPFNTYRYRLQRGIEILTDWLWARMTDPSAT